MKNIEISSNKYHLLFIVILLCLSCFMIFYMGPLSQHPGFDFFFHLRRLESLMQAMSEGTFPYYIDYTAVDNYGYLTKFFYADVMLIPFAFIGLFTNSMFAYNSMIFCMTVLCGIFMYMMTWRVYRNGFVAIVSSIVYTFGVYRIYDIYERSALGEGVALTFIPLVFLGAYEIIFGDYRKWYWLTIGFTCLIFTHVITTVLMFIALIVYIAIYYKRMIGNPLRIKSLLLAGMVTVFTSAYYLFPFLEQHFGDTFLYHINTDEILQTVWKGALLGLLSGITYWKDFIFCGIGIILTILVILRVFVRKDDENRNLLRKTDVLLILGIIYYLLPLKIFPWEQGIFKLLNFIQFTWRLWILTCAFFSIAGAYYLYLLVKNSARKKTISLLLVVGCTVLTLVIHNKNYIYLQTNKHLQVNANLDPWEKAQPANWYNLISAEYLPAQASVDYIIEKGESVSANNPDTRIIGLMRDKHTTVVDVDVRHDDTLELPLVYYKGYAAELNGKFLEAEESKNGLVQVNVTESGRIKAYYSGTTIQRIGVWTSIVSILLLVCYIVYINNRKRNRFTPADEI